jgi:hypothetical protein
MKQPISDAERWQRYKRSTGSRALTRVAVLVPIADADLIRRLAERRRIRAQLAAPFHPEPEPTA